MLHCTDSDRLHYRFVGTHRNVWPRTGSVSLVKLFFQHRVKLHRCVILPTQTRFVMSISAVRGSQYNLNTTTITLMKCLCSKYFLKLEHLGVACKCDHCREKNCLYFILMLDRCQSQSVVRCALCPAELVLPGNLNSLMVWRVNKVLSWLLPRGRI